MRRALELLTVALAGAAALAFPVLTGQAGRGHEAAFLPFMADVAEGVQGSSLLLLLLVGVVAGVFGKSPAVLLGLASAALLPLWSAVDVVMGGGGHNLLPFEWLIYGVYGVIGVAGAVGGRVVARRWLRSGTREAG
jgi:hypothetical protein